MLYPGPVVAQVEAGNLAPAHARDESFALTIETYRHRTSHERAFRPHGDLEAIDPGGGACLFG